MIQALTFDFWDTIAADDSDEPKRAQMGLPSKADERVVLFVDHIVRCYPHIEPDEAAQAFRQANARFREEWHNHHQGGATAYAGRTCKGAPGEPFPVLEQAWRRRVNDVSGIDVSFGAAFAWNPSATGVKSEDTFLLLPDGTKQIVTATPDLPQVDLASVLGRDTRVVKSGIAH